MKRLFLHIWFLGIAPVLLGQTNLTPEQVLTPTQTAQGQFDMGVRFMQDKKYSGAVEAFQRALESKPDFYEAYNNWGISLVQLSKEDPVMASRLEKLQLAADKFSKAAAIKPSERITYMLWSETLSLIGDSPVDGRVRLACYQGAVEKCRKAIELAPTEWEAYNKWAALLSTKLSEFATDDPTRVSLYKESAGLFAKAAEYARFSGELGPVYANWGSALMRAARITTDLAEKKNLLADAAEKFERSARAIPSAATTYSMWGSALVERGKYTRLRGDLREGIDRLNTSVSLNSKDAATLYNLACAYALMDNHVLAVQTLKKCFEYDTDRRFFINAPQDPDLASLRTEVIFQELFRPTEKRGMPAGNPRLGDFGR